MVEVTEEVAVMVPGVEVELALVVVLVVMLSMVQAADLVARVHVKNFPFTF